jgi:Zn finger protein HypA/HybF involved in hydrogenase expression
MTDQHIDGNGAAGLLEELLATDVTSALRSCGSCGQESPLGEHLAYRGAGLVLRCPTCEDVAIRVIAGEREAVVEVLGRFRIRRSR